MKKLFFIVVFIMSVSPLIGQDDTTKVAVDKGWNAMQYSLQKRYQPKGEPFVQEKFTDHTFISLSGSGFGLIPSDNTNPAHGANFSIGVGKWFDRSNALRIEMGGTQYHRRKITVPTRLAELFVAHQFNMSNYLRGYKESRFCEISTVEGVSGFAANSGKTWKFGAGVHLGFNFSFRLNTHIDLYLEPLFSFYTAGVDPAIQEDWHKYDLSYRYTMGLRYNFFKIKKPQKIHWLERDVNGYMFYGGGVQSQYSDLVLNKVGLFKSLGPHLFVGAGSWVKDFFGVRGSLFYSNHLWASYQDFGNMQAHYMGARLEITLEPFYLVHKRAINERRFTCAFILGPEIGYMNRKDVEKDYRTIYIGATVACQPNVKITKNVGLYLEPRFSLVPYSVNESSGIGGIMVRNGYFDAIFNLNIGFTYSL